MKLKNLLFASLVIFAFASCAKDKTAPDPTVDEEQGVPTYASFTIHTSAATGRANDVGFPGNTPNDEENAIRNIAIFIYNSSRMLETVYTKMFDAGDFQDGIYSDIIETKTGRHYVYAIVNTPALLYDAGFSSAYQIGGMESILLSQVIDLNSIIPDLGRQATIKSLMGLENISNQGGFFMMTPEPVSANFSEYPESSSNRITLTVKRALAKVSVAFAPEQEFYGKLTNVEYDVVNNPSRMFVIPQYISATSNALYTPNYRDSENGQVKPDNYTTTSAKGWQRAITSKDASAYTWTYATENSNSVALEGNTTCVAIKGKFVPANAYLVDADGTAPANLNSDGDFWVIADYNDESGYYDIYNFEKIYTEKPSDAELAAAKAASATGDAAIISYEKGMCYYALWLNNSDASSKGESPWTVARNSYYKVTINSVGGPGKSGLEEGDGDGDGGIIDPPIPLERNTTIKATVVVADWEPVSQSGGI